MQSYTISLNSIDKVKSFVNIIATFDGDIDLVSERYIIDAKSIMGIFSLDLSKKLRLDVHSAADVAIVPDKLKEFLV
jgi:phosphotransferase system HPr-like phosphotransfer protein